MKTLQITAVNAILSIARPIFVIKCADGTEIVRSPKELFRDLQNSARCLSMAHNALDNGIEGLAPHDREQFVRTAIGLAGATVIGDIRQYKAGDTYVVTGNHPALKDKNHKAYGTVKDGGTLIAEKDGTYVEGFLSMPLTQLESMQASMKTELTAMYAAMLGITTTAPAVPVNNAPANTAGSAFEDDAAEEASKEAIGARASKATAKATA